MPRDIFGNYTLPALNPVVTGTTIASAWANNTLNDIATALTASLSIDGSVTTAKLADNSVTTNKLAANAVTTPDILDANVTLPKIDQNLMQGVSNPNYLVNGALQWYQGGITFTSGTGARYVADQVCEKSVGTTYTCNRIAFTPGTSPPVQDAQAYIETVVTSVNSAANYCNLNFPIESVRILAGQSVTFSFWANVSVNNAIAVSVLQNFGTTGSPSTAVETYIQQISLVAASGWARYSCTFTMPSVSGKTLGTDSSSDFTCIRIWMDSNTGTSSLTGALGQHSGTYRFWGVKLEAGSVMTAFTIPDVYLEQLRCYRFLVNRESSSGFQPLIFSGNVTSGQLYYCHSIFPAQMRTTPSMVYVQFGTANLATGTGTSSPWGTELSLTATGTGAAIWSGAFAADARYVV